MENFLTDLLQIIIMQVRWENASLTEQGNTQRLPLLCRS